MTKTATPEMIADGAMKRIWTDWLAYHNAQFAGRKYYITAADQMAFYEIAQPVMRSLAASPPPAVEPVAVKPLDMFMHNVDAWGAAEWFGRLADAVRGHDAARMSGDEFADITADTFKNIMTSSAFRLARDFEAQVRSALATPSTDHPTAVEPVMVKPLEWRHDGTTSYAYCPVTDVRWIARNHEERKRADDIRATRIRSALAAPSTDLREENERLEAERAEQWRLRREMEASRDMERALAATLSAENAALTERLERVEGLVQRAKTILPQFYEDWHECVAAALARV